MLGTVFRQNYTNYKLIHIDDTSVPKVRRKLRKFMEKFRKKRNITLILNEKREYALANRHKCMTEYCSEGDIIFDVDGDDQLIGNQVFRVVNALYQKNPKKK